MFLHQQKLISLMLNCGSPAVQPAKETLAEAGKWTLLPAPRLDEGQALVCKRAAFEWAPAAGPVLSTEKEWLP